MKVLFPMNSKTEQDQISDIFGRCEYFAIHDTEKGKTEFVKNPGIKQASGAGVKAAQVAADHEVSKVYVTRVGPRAEEALKQAGIEIVQTEGKTLKELIQQLRTE